MRRHLRAGTLLLFFLPLLACTGCGGGSGSGNAKASGTSTPEGKPSSARGAFLARAEGICLQVNKQIAILKPKSESPAEIVRVAGPHAAIERASISELSRLTPPAAVAHDWRQIVTDRRALADELAALVKAARANDSAAIQRLAASKKKTHKKLLAAATRAGFKSCSQVG